MGNLTPDAGSLVEGWFSSTLCGINIVLYFLCLRVLCGRSTEQSSRARWLLAVSSTLQVLVCFGQSSVFLASNMHAFVILNGGQRGAVYIAKNNNPLAVAEECFYTVNDWIGSGVLLWRAYVINRRNWKLTWPLVPLWAASMVALVGSLYQLTHLSSTANGNFDKSLAGWILAFIVLSLTLQAAATALIAWRICVTINWRERRAWAREWHALRIIVESGLIYGILTFLSLIFYLAKDRFGGINAGILAQISATCPFLIILRAHAFREKETQKHRVKLDRNRWTLATGGSSGSSEETGHEMDTSSRSTIPIPESAHTHYTIEVQLPPDVDKV